MKNRIFAGILATFMSALILGCTPKEGLIASDEFTFPEKEAPISENESEISVTDPSESESIAENASIPENESIPEESQSVSQVYVHICGAVKNPGVICLQEGSRIFDAVQMAGGFSEDADQDYINQVQLLADGMKITIPTCEEAKALREMENADKSLVEEMQTDGLKLVSSGDGLSEKNKSENGLVDINHADISELCTITGIGEGRAKAIVAYREKQGSFTSVEQIMNVEGIKQGTFDKIKDQICIK